MEFKFNVNMNDNDYLEYNKFWQFRSHYGKKEMKKYRIIFAVICGLPIITSLFDGGITVDYLIGIIPSLILICLFQLCLKPIFILILKRHIKVLKKKGKLGYTPVSVLEFYDDCFTETTDTEKTEQKYTSIERISIVDRKYIYIHTNSVQAYILPFAAFEYGAQYNEFLDFIKTKCESITVY